MDHHTMETAVVVRKITVSLFVVVVCLSNGHHVLWTKALGDAQLHSYDGSF